MISARLSFGATSWNILDTSLTIEMMSLEKLHWY